MAGTFYQLVRFLRYHFLLWAGLLPYLLGSSLAATHDQRFDLELFSLGLGGLVFVLLGVEAFNEYFDWVLGTDRVFQLAPKPVTRRTFLVGLLAFGLAGLVAVYLTWRVGWPIIIIALSGFLAALFYLAPPLKLTYRGLGEAVIALSYGPLMMSGAYYLQRRQLDERTILVSLAPALLLYLVALLNEVPDYYQDKLVGKRNICVRLGRARTIKLAGGLAVLFYLLLLAGLLSGLLPRLSGLSFLALPLSLVTYLRAKRTYDTPLQFIRAIRYLLIQYVIILSILIVACWAK